MSLQERTLVVKNFDPNQTTKQILHELFIQTGPVRNIVAKPDHAFVEFEDVASVGYSKALLDGIMLHGRKISLEPKVHNKDNFKYCEMIQDYIKYSHMQMYQQQQQQHIMLNQQNHQMHQFINQPQVYANCTTNQYQPQIQPNQHIVFNDTGICYNPSTSSRPAIQMPQHVRFHANKYQQPIHDKESNFSRFNNANSRHHPYRHRNRNNKRFL